MSENAFELGSGESNIERIRHSAAHIMAQAVKRMYPEAKFGVGPTIENGFYYDMHLNTTLDQMALNKIEKEMRKIVSSNFEFKRSEMSKTEALEFFKGKDQDFKLEIINDLGHDKFSIYEQGEFIDLCRGPHINKTSELKHFKLLRVSGAYWRGDEKRPMLQRIYGTAFEKKEELDEYLHMLEESKKRDHRKLGTELDLFMMHPWAPASPFFLEKGAIIYNTLQSYIRQFYNKSDYKEVITPQIFDTELWRVSGHYEHYIENMFLCKFDEREFGVKPMNCPGHCLIFKGKKWSYRDLPYRMADFGRLHRYERSGAVSGITRVRSFCQDDAHIFCRMEQIQEEIKNLLKFVYRTYEIFGFGELKVLLSTRPAGVLGNKERWDTAEAALEEVLKSEGIKYSINAGDGTFYGPKIDCMVKDAIKREWQVATIQLDFNLPERFELKFTNEKGEDERPVMIHRAVFGSIERFIGVLIEHTAGIFPVWLAPVQVRVIPVNETCNDFSQKIVDEFKKIGVRVDFDLRNESLGKKTRETQMQKVPYMIVIGNKEMESGNVSVRKYGSQDAEDFTLTAFTEKLSKEVTIPKVV